MRGNLRYVLCISEIYLWYILWVEIFYVMKQSQFMNELEVLSLLVPLMQHHLSVCHWSAV